MKVLVYVMVDNTMSSKIIGRDHSKRVNVSLIAASKNIEENVVGEILNVNICDPIVFVKYYYSN